MRAELSGASVVGEERVGLDERVVVERGEAAVVESARRVVRCWRYGAWLEFLSKWCAMLGIGKTVQRCIACRDAVHLIVDAGSSGWYIYGVFEAGASGRERVSSVHRV